MPQVIAGILSHIADMTAFSILHAGSPISASAATRRRVYISGSGAKPAATIRIPPPPRASTAARSFDPRTRSATRILPIPSSSTPVSTVYAAAQTCPQARDINFYTASEEVRSQYKDAARNARGRKAAAKKRANLSPPPAADRCGVLYEVRAAKSFGRRNAHGVLPQTHSVLSVAVVEKFHTSCVSLKPRRGATPPSNLRNDAADARGAGF